MSRNFFNTIFFLTIITSTLVSCSAKNTTTQPNDSLPQPLMAQLDSTAHFYVYHPDVYHIDLVCGERPDTMDNEILFCAEAAFTGKIVDSFYYKNIAGDLVAGGEYHRGYECNANSGGFIFYKDGHWEFLAKEAYQTKLANDTTVQCAYEQAILIENGVVHRPYLMKPERKEVYRVLCENTEGKLMVVTGREDTPYAEFVQYLIDELQVKNALYMDMGTGWNFSWYRNIDSTFTTFFPMAKWTPYQTNWLIFKK